MTTATILIIEDDLLNILLIIRILEDSDLKLKILTSTNSWLGIEIANQTKPNLIITALQLPELNGMDLILELKKYEHTKEIPIIIISKIESSHDFMVSLENGAFDFMCKPINEIEFVARIKSALRFVEYYNQKNEKSHLEKNCTIENNSYKNISVFNTSLLKNKAKEQSNQFKTKPNIFELNNSKINVDLKNIDFIRRISNQYPNLTANERKLCAYLQSNLNTKEIANITSKSTRSIEIARTRLREKLGLKGGEKDIYSFLLNF